MELISKHRSEIMAIAMIWIALFHSYFGYAKPISFVINVCGYGGVDVFMFLSGFGVYFAYKKNNNYLYFIKRRLLRILPYNIVICIIMKFVYDRTIIETIYDALGLSLIFRLNLINWYTSLMVILYLLTPLYIKLFDKKPLLITIITIVLFFLVCINNSDYQFGYKWFRSAVYILGIYFAYLYDNKKKINNILLVIIMILGWATMYYLYHYVRNDVQYVYPMIMIIPGLLIVLAYILDKITIFNGILKWMGQYTYQFYMIHLVVRDVLYYNYAYLYERIRFMNFDTFINLFALFAAFILAILLTKIIEFIKKEALKA